MRELGLAWLTQIIHSLAPLPSVPVHHLQNIPVSPSGPGMMLCPALCLQNWRPGYRTENYGASDGDRGSLGVTGTTVEAKAGSGAGSVSAHQSWISGMIHRGMVWDRGSPPAMTSLLSF